MSSQVTLGDERFSTPGKSAFVRSLIRVLSFKVFRESLFIFKSLPTAWMRTPKLWVQRVLLVHVLLEHLFRREHIPTSRFGTLVSKFVHDSYMTFHRLLVRKRFPAAGIRAHEGPDSRVLTRHVFRQVRPGERALAKRTLSPRSRRALSQLNLITSTASLAGCRAERVSIHQRKDRLRLLNRRLYNRRRHL